MSDQQLRGRRNLFISLVTVAALLLGGGIAVAISYDSIKNYLSKFVIEDYNQEAGPETTITIVEGDDGAAVAKKMVEADIVKSFDAVYREMLNADFTIYPGTYAFPTKLSGAQALRILIEGKNRVVNQVTIPEGMRIQQIVPLVSEALGIDEAELFDALDSQMSRIDDRAPTLEGYLFPATYTFDPNVDAKTVISTMVDRMEAELASFGRELKDSHDLLSLAALIQAEGKHEEDFFKISRVFANRLDKGMLLQSDPTVKYRYQGEQSNFTGGVKDASNPFNTYIYKGVPVGPVGNPGSLAIEAALRPADGNWLFFVAINLKTGETVFSETLAEHERAAELYRQWLRDNPDWNE
ncbi:MAG: endolytic transglycosylase MltG [Actinomycetota bacterium]